LEAGAGLPSFLYNHFDRSFLIGVGLWVGACWSHALFLCSHALISRVLSLICSLRSLTLCS
jgi:hypothetical protein